MKLVNIKILALLVISYSLALTALTPVAWQVPYFEPQLQSLGITIVQAEGNNWRGKILINERNLGFVTIGWDTRFAPLLLGKLPATITVNNANMDISGELTLSPLSISVSNLSGYIDEVAFEDVYQNYGADLSGRLQMSDIHAKLGWGNTLQSASGELSWSGGPIRIPVGRTMQTYQVPTLLGVISSTESQWQLAINGANQQDYIQASLSKEGVAQLSVKRSLITDMNVPLPGNGSTVFEMSQQVF